MFHILNSLGLAALVNLTSEEFELINAQIAQRRNKIIRLPVTKPRAENLTPLQQKTYSSRLVRKILRAYLESDHKYFLDSVFLGWTYDYQRAAGFSYLKHEIRKAIVLKCLILLSQRGDRYAYAGFLNLNPALRRIHKRKARRNKNRETLA